MNMRSAKNIAYDFTGFYPESLKLVAKKFIATHGNAEEKKNLMKAPEKNVMRIGDSKVQRISGAVE